MFDTGLFDAIVGFVDPGFYLRASAQPEESLWRHGGRAGSRKGCFQAYSVVDDPLDRHKYSERGRHDYIQ